MKTIHERIVVAMQKEGVTQTALASKTGISLSNVCRLVHGRSGLSVPTFIKILKALPNTDALWLLTGGRRNGKR